MVAENLPCAEKSCSSRMSLIEEKDNILYYKCLEKHNAHYFRYDVGQKQWERLIVTRKLVLHFEQDPYFEDGVAESLNQESVPEDFEIEQSPIDDFETEESIEAPDAEKTVADELEIEKSVVDEFEQSLVAPAKTPEEEVPAEEPVVEAPKKEPVVEAPKEEPVVDDSKEDVEVVSDLRKIKGIGSQQLSDLQEAGVHTISDLANSSASDLSRKTGYAVSQLINWIVKAKTLSEDEAVIPA